MPYGTQPTWDEVKKRFWWNVIRLPLFWKWEELNPYVKDGEGDLKPKERTAWEDIGHSLENLGVEGWRKLRKKLQQWNYSKRI